MAQQLQVIAEEDVGKHNSAKDCWLIIGNDRNGGKKVYDVTKYLDDHPGGPEIMLEFAGKDADDMFEDIGHSSEARTAMNRYLIGDLKVDPNAAKKKKELAVAQVKSSGGLNPMAVVLLLLAIAGGIIFQYFQGAK